MPRRNASARSFARRSRLRRARRSLPARRQAWLRRYELTNPAPPLRQVIHKFRQFVGGDNLQFPSSALTTYNGRAQYLVQSAAGEANWAFGFALSDTSQSTTFTALYDQYRIRMIKIHLRPQIAMQAQALVSLTGAIAAVAGVVPCGNIYTATDVDDAVVPTVAVLRQFDTVRCDPVLNSGVITHTIFPRVMLGTFTAVSATTTGNALAPYGTWLDCGSAGINHYGFKVAVDQGVTGMLQVWEIDLEYYLEFKNVR